MLMVRGDKGRDCFRVQTVCGVPLMFSSGSVQSRYSGHGESIRRGSGKLISSGFRIPRVRRRRCVRLFLDHGLRQIRPVRLNALRVGELR